MFSKDNVHVRLFCGLVGALLLMVFVSPAALSAQAPLPPRPTPTIMVDSESESAMIVLHFQAGADSAAALDWPALWTAVEWQDDQEQWNVVEGWQGGFDAVDAGVGKKSWGVDDAVLGKGPFRWVVYGQQGGARLAVSDEFTLPASSSGTVVVTVATGDVTPMLLPVSGNSWGVTPWLLVAGLVMVLCGLSISYRKSEC